ncbi:MAG: hypothetical protein FWG88_04160 [Oscillospiraceae bacterium]|nr:hypothetical protein [Oscillospiraceae bacterium]
MTWKLIKLNLAALFARTFRGTSKKRKKSSVVLFVILAIYIAVMMLFSVGGMFYLLCTPFFTMGIGWLYFALAGIIVFVICFLSNVFMIQSSLFNAQDNELLLSMPIKPSAILAGRLCSLLVVDYAYIALIIIPVIAVLSLTGNITAIPPNGIVLFVVSAILLPLFVTSLSALVGYVVALISSRMRNKNIITLILSVGFLILYIYFYMNMMGNLGNLLLRGTEIAKAVQRAIPPAYHFGIAAAQGSFLSFLIFALCSILPFILMYILLSISFNKIVAGSRSEKKRVYQEKALKTSGSFNALVMREIRLFLSMPMYILNAALGGIACLAITVLLLVRPSVLTDPLDMIKLIVPDFNLGLIVAATITVLASLNFISAPSISLEGKTLWVVKSLPLQPRSILLSKVCAHVYLSTIPSVLAGIVCIFVLKITQVMGIVMILILPMTITIMQALIGVTVNLAFPRFDWINPLQPVKQGMSVFISLLGEMALMLTLVFLYAFVLIDKIKLDLYLYLCIGMFLVFSALLYLYLTKAGSRKFETL